MKKSENIFPHKEYQTGDMFDDISVKYDFLNKIISLGIDCIWRNNLVRKLKTYNPRNVLDIATGTGDLAIRIAKLKPHSIVGVDISKKMLGIGQKKIQKHKLDNLIKLKLANCNKLPFKNESFDVVTISFGVRNFNEPLKAMKEIYRVTENNGVSLLLEFGIPQNPIIKIPFLFYFTKLLPLIGGLISGHKTAYSYLTASVKRFPFGKDFLKMLEEAGFVETTFKKYSFGITYLYIARKKI